MTTLYQPTQPEIIDALATPWDKWPHLRSRLERARRILTEFRVEESCDNVMRVLHVPHRLGRGRFDWLSNGQVYQRVAAVFVLEIQTVATMFLARDIHCCIRDLGVQNRGSRSAKFREPIPDRAKRDIKRCHALLSVDQVEHATATGADDDAANEVLRRLLRGTIAHLFANIFQKLFDLIRIPDIFALIAGHGLEGLEEAGH